MDLEKTLIAKWSKRQNDIMIYFPSSPDGRVLHSGLFGKRLEYNIYEGIDGDMRKVIEKCSLIEEFEKRGYDITTLKFSIKKK